MLTAVRFLDLPLALPAERPVLNVDTVHTSRGTVGIGELPMIGTRPDTASSARAKSRGGPGSPIKASGSSTLGPALP
jgi:hypothetical protein